MSEFTDWLSGISVGDIGNLSSGLLGAAGYRQLMSDLQKTGQQAQQGAQEIGRQAIEGTRFQPYTVTTASGGQMGYGADGNITMGLGAGEQALQNQLMGQAGTMFGRAGGDIGQATQNIYGNMAAAMQPEMERQRLQNEQRQLAQGQMGLSSNMFGGMDQTTFGMNKAQQEAMNNAYMQARGLAGQEAAQAGQLGSSMLQGAYVPQAQLLNAMQQGTAVQELADLARRQGVQLSSEAGMAGLDAMLQAQLGAGNLGGQGMAALAAMLGNSGVTKDGVSIGGGLLSGLTLGDIGSGISSGWDWLNQNIFNSGSTTPNNTSVAFNDTMVP